MDRLTQTSDKGGVAFKFDLDITCKVSEMQKILKIAERLKEYEDLDEQGLILRLPYPPGTKVYYLEYNEDYDEIYYEIREAFIDYRWANCDRKLYLTYAEAEVALASKQQAHAEAVFDERNGR